MISREDKELAIQAVEESKATHVVWLEHLAVCPDCPDARVAGDKTHHVKQVAKYNHVLTVLREGVEVSAA